MNEHFAVNDEFGDDETSKPHHQRKANQMSNEKELPAKRQRVNKNMNDHLLEGFNDESSPFHINTMRDEVEEEIQKPTEPREITPSIHDRLQVSETPIPTTEPESSAQADEVKDAAHTSLLSPEMFDHTVKKRKRRIRLLGHNYSEHSSDMESVASTQAPPRSDIESFQEVRRALRGLRGFDPSPALEEAERHLNTLLYDKGAARQACSEGREDIRSTEREIKSLEVKLKTLKKRQVGLNESLNQAFTRQKEQEMEVKEIKEISKLISQPL